MTNTQTNQSIESIVQRAVNYHFKNSVVASNHLDKEDIIQISLIRAYKEGWTDIYDKNKNNSYFYYISKLVHREIGNKIREITAQKRADTHSVSLQAQITGDAELTYEDTLESTNNILAYEEEQAFSNYRELIPEESRHIYDALLENNSHSKVAAMFNTTTYEIGKAVKIFQAILKPYVEAYQSGK